MKHEARMILVSKLTIIMKRFEKIFEAIRSLPEEARRFLVFVCMVVAFVLIFYGWETSLSLRLEDLSSSRPIAATIGTPTSLRGSLGFIAPPLSGIGAVQPYGAGGIRETSLVTPGIFRQVGDGMRYFAAGVFSGAAHVFKIIYDAL